jgi:protein-S-isoprenylcysteine O-methyltransferase Ste14
MVGALVGGLWLVFVTVWLVAATRAKRQARSTMAGVVFRLALIVTVALLVRASVVSRAVHHVHGPIVNAYRAEAWLGVALCATGIGIAIWARFYIGRNWGMPMSLREGHELITTGPYAFVRHPIYSGILVAVLGTALAFGGWSLVLVALFFAYFIFAALTEERTMTQQFPAQYPAYRQRTKMLIPFVF